MATPLNPLFVAFMRMVGAIRVEPYWRFDIVVIDGMLRPIGNIAIHGHHNDN